MNTVVTFFFARGLEPQLRYQPQGTSLLGGNPNPIPTTWSVNCRPTKEASSNTKKKRGNPLAAPY
jgi:hypothetical protein